MLGEQLRLQPSLPSTVVIMPFEMPFHNPCSTASTHDKPENPETIRDVLKGISQADSRDYPTILRQFLEGLMAQNLGNWASVRDELVGIVKDEVA